jgi:hypothetical protein
MREYKDPLLVEFDEEQSTDTKDGSGKKSTMSDGSDEDSGKSGASSGSEESSEEDAGDQIPFPKDNVQDLLQFISRDLTNLNNTEDA